MSLTKDIVGLRLRPRSIDCLVEYVTARFAKATKNACCIPASILLHELLLLNGHSSNVQKGVLIVDYDGAKKASFHCWVETTHAGTRRQLDVGHDVLSRQVPEMADFPTSRQTSSVLPVGCVRIDMNDREAIKALVDYSKMIDAFHDGQPFWPMCSVFLQDIRASATIDMAPRA